MGFTNNRDNQLLKGVGVFVLRVCCCTLVLSASKCTSGTDLTLSGLSSSLPCIRVVTSARRMLRTTKSGRWPWARRNLVESSRQCYLLWILSATYRYLETHSTAVSLACRNNCSTLRALPSTLTLLSPPTRTTLRYVADSVDVNPSHIYLLHCGPFQGPTYYYPQN